MPPATGKKEKEAIAMFSCGHQLGAVGTALMCSAADEAPGFIDAATGLEIEEELDKEEVKQKIIKGEYRPCTIDDIYYLFPRDKKK